MRKLELLIADSRRETENTTFTASTGIQDEEFIRYANDAQVQMQAAISNVSPSMFQSEKTIQCVANQEAYNIPSNAFLGNRLDLVEFSQSGNVNDYYELKQGQLPERIAGTGSSSSSFYIRRSGKILLQPKPQSSGSKLRVTFQKRLPVMDLQRGIVSSVVLDTVARTITSLTLDTTQTIDKQKLEEQGFISVVTKYGAQQMRNIPVASVDDSTGVVTVEAGFVYDEDETISVGDYLVSGGDASTHSELPDICERYLISYMNWKIFKRDSSNDSVEAQQEVLGLQQNIVDSFTIPDTDIDYVTVVDDQFIINDDLLY